jgi:hypothetical protein
MNPTTETIVQYLESVGYELTDRSHAVPLLSIAGHFWSERDESLIGISDLPHDDGLCNASIALCTGDGFRWQAGTPELRFR